ncbi:hypothetical protein KR032_000485, partial [Drosophila birchii]
SIMQEPPPEYKNQVRYTYCVTIVMLIVGQIQVFLAMESTSLKNFLEKRYFLSLIQFFVSFLSIQLYGFFYRMIVEKSKWVRILCGLWTYQVNTFSIMKPAKKAPYLSLGISFVLTYLMMGCSALYGHAAKSHKKGLFIPRHKVILWSERIFVLTCFGIIVCAELKHVTFEFPTLLIYTLMSNVFVIIFSASIRRPNFYRTTGQGDYILIGQLYYLNYFALYMGIVWTTASFMDIMQWDDNI